MVFDSVRQQLSPLDFSTPNPSSEAEKEFFRFYGIDFEERMASVEHFFGSLQVSDFDLACHWYRQSGAKSCCYIVHGYYDHAGLYGHLIEYFLKANRNVVIFDLPGHGLSSGPRASIDAFSNYVEALRYCVERSGEIVPIEAEFVGQSTGAAVIMQYLLNTNWSVDIHAPKRVALLAPLVRPFRWSMMRHVFALNYRLFDSIPRRFSENSHDEDFLRFLRHEDPLQHDRLPMQWVFAMRAWLGEFLQQPANDAVQPLVIQGKQDRTVDWGFNVAQIQQKFPRAELCLLDTARHHLANESSEIRTQMVAILDRYFSVDRNTSEPKKRVAA